jgi:hypothetical protein
MKKLFFVISAIVCLASCGIGGYQMNGISGKERAEYLKSIKPYGAHWVKESMTSDQRLIDWVDCGGAEGLNDGYERKPGISTNEFFDGLVHHRKKIRACMDGKGYNWIENCDTRCMYP